MPDLLKTLVVLGARGDMTGRLLLPALVRLAGSGDLPEGLQVLAVDRDASDDDAYRDHARGKLDAHLPDRDDKAADALLERLSYRRADVTSADDLRAALEDVATPMAVYLALPNVLFRPTLQALADAGLPRGTTVVVEKPFGGDLADAQALNALIGQSFDEHHVSTADATATRPRHPGTRRAPATRPQHERRITVCAAGGDRGPEWVGRRPDHIGSSPGEGAQFRPGAQLAVEQVVDAADRGGQRGDLTVDVVEQLSELERAREQDPAAGAQHAASSPPPGSVASGRVDPHQFDHVDDADRVAVHGLRFHLCGRPGL